MKCKHCKKEPVMIEYFSFASDYPERFRLYCGFCNSYGAWRKTKIGAEKAWTKGLVSGRKDEPE